MVRRLGGVLCLQVGRSPVLTLYELEPTDKHNYAHVNIFLVSCVRMCHDIHLDTYVLNTYINHDMYVFMRVCTHQRTSMCGFIYL